jgi:diguanylate cyclase (GGDEF)-like protein
MATGGARAGAEAPGCVVMNESFSALWVAEGAEPPVLPGVTWLASPPDHVDGAVVAEVWWQLSPVALEERLFQPTWDTHLLTTAIVMVAPDAALEQRCLWLGRGVQDVLADAHPSALFRAMAHAVARKRREVASRLAYATDLATGLPHQLQLIEHINHLLALREREPAPMVLIALRLQGLERAAERLGDDAASVLRRKLAVRLRSGLRAGDVVASMGSDSFGVLLSHVEAAADGEQVMGKLVRTLEAPIQVAGQPFGLQVSAGLACYPQHGRQAGELLQRAQAQAQNWAAMGRDGVGRMVQHTGQTPANDPDGA